MLAMVASTVIAVQASAVDIQEAFEAGAHERVIAAAQGSAEPTTLYLAGLSLVELDHIPEAREKFEELAGRPADDAWHFVGVSALRLNSPAPAGGAAADPDAEEAEAAARAAVGLDDGPALAYYQLGLTLGRKQAYEEAAAAFEAVIARDPAFAYAHYYAGLSYYQFDRTDRMAAAFEAFLKLAPEAPERARVESVLRTLRGR